MSVEACDCDLLMRISMLWGMPFMPQRGIAYLFQYLPVHRNSEKVRNAYPTSFYSLHFSTTCC